MHPLLRVLLPRSIWDNGQKWSQALVTGGVLRKAESQTLPQGAQQGCAEVQRAEKHKCVCRASNSRWLRATWCQAGVGVGEGQSDCLQAKASVSS